MPIFCLSSKGVCLYVDRKHAHASDLAYPFTYWESVMKDGLDFACHPKVNAFVEDRHVERVRNSNGMHIYERRYLR